jgi:hypothetical protein
MDTNKNELTALKIKNIETRVMLVMRSLENMGIEDLANEVQNIWDDGMIVRDENPDFNYAEWRSGADIINMNEKTIDIEAVTNMVDAARSYLNDAQKLLYQK